MKKLLLLFILFSVIGANAQYNLKFKVNGLKDTTIFLARYLGDKLYYADTAESKNGVIEFEKQFDEGVYTKRTALIDAKKHYENCDDKKYVLYHSNIHGICSNEQDVFNNIEEYNAN